MGYSLKEYRVVGKTATGREISVRVQATASWSAILKARSEFGIVETVRVEKAADGAPAGARKEGEI